MTADRASVLPPSCPPRGLSLAEAAAYVGLSVTKFEQRVKLGALPKALPFGPPRVWDRKALDLALDRHSKLPAESQPDADKAKARGAWNARQDALRHRKAQQAQA